MATSLQASKAQGKEEGKGFLMKAQSFFCHRMQMKQIQGHIIENHKAKAVKVLRKQKGTSPEKSKYIKSTTIAFKNNVIKEQLS